MFVGSGEAMAVAAKKHQEFLRVYQQWPAMLISAERPLTIGRLKFTEAGFFTKLQILTDLKAKASSLVTLPHFLGSGVKLDQHLNTTCLLEVLGYLNTNSQFRRHAGRLSLFELAHFICEVRQWTWQGASASTWQEVLSSFASDGALPLEHKDRGRFQALTAELYEMSRKQ
jgi:hypothetical protein